MNLADPFLNSNTLAVWAAEVLLNRGIDDVALWRMLEYWFQVELYRAVEAGMAAEWKHLGELEQPYFTDYPKATAKSQIKWADLVLWEPEKAAQRVVWIELKDVGRSENTIRNNARGLGRDLAALWSFRLSETQQIWGNPPANVIDRGRIPEWKTLAPILFGANHLISQIVIAPKEMSKGFTPDALEKLWLDAFKQRIGVRDPKAEFKIGRAETKRFRVHALVFSLSEQRGESVIP